ncbi:MAG: YhjD/YihY/BrkB family envelope integrity protein [Gemmatimonadota bacterium]
MFSALRSAVLQFLRALWTRVEADELFFMAGAICFNVVAAAVPFLLLVVGLSATFLAARFGDPGGAILGFLLEAVPAVGGDIELEEGIRQAAQRLVEDRTGLSMAGALFLLWFSTRLVATLRVVLGRVYGIPEGRGIIRGKAVDALFVMAGGLLILTNLGVSFLASSFYQTLSNRLPSGFSRELGQLPFGGLFAFGSVWISFFLIYHYVPSRRPHWPLAVLSATFTAIAFELMKSAFGWYAGSVADYRSIYGNLATGAILFFWIYYGAAVFILGGQVGRVFHDMREREMERTTSKGGDPQEGGGASVALLVAFLLGGVGVNLFSPAALASQILPDAESGVTRVVQPERAMELSAPLLDHTGPYIVVHLAENRVFLMEGPSVVWSAPAGTGNGFTLAGGGQNWTFDTPAGLFRILRKEKDPMWEAPDWWYVQRNLPIPTWDHPSRYMAGVMGNTALYLGDGLAIHGTDRPELLQNPDPEDRRVSHGCIRLTNEAARSLFHMVEVGTPVLIY